MADKLDSIEDLVFMAKLTEQAERYDEMVKCMKKVVQKKPDLTVEERNLLSVAFKNVIGSRRASWRIVTSIELKEQSKGNDRHVTFIQSYRAQVEKELAEICQDILGLLEKELIPTATTGESKTFLYKMKADYHRYFAETAPGEEQKELALAAYTTASEIATSSLAPTHPIRLGLALNFSVFHFEIRKKKQKRVFNWPRRLSMKPSLSLTPWMRRATKKAP
eukprot:NODE_1394_length_936_cov_477.348365_g1074_i0.p1 GENE.NODE_1394_length_936_cov_477.348365_g1074_i0~~NODE_1394_length_936_cov_477.348365_g1074_i0.p1  ORF type:complete len:241 (+),score=69.00 NODE_1394_length_936_cov_477.348365_g1074_i0:62-724(+)